MITLKQQLPQSASELAIVQFVTTRLVEVSAVRYFAHARFEQFMELIEQGNWAEALKEYRFVTGAGASECRAAVSIALSLP